MTGYMAVCQDCGWEQPTLTRDQAEHIGRVHERRMDHLTMIGEIDG